MNIFITEAGAGMLGEQERIITQSKQSWGNREALSNNSLPSVSHTVSLCTSKSLTYCSGCCWDQWPCCGLAATFNLSWAHKGEKRGKKAVECKCCCLNRDVSDTFVVMLAARLWGRQCPCVWAEISQRLVDGWRRTSVQTRRTKCAVVGDPMTFMLVPLWG